MPDIILAGDGTGATAVPNLFIDEYMPKAHGDFVKVYLYLLHTCSGENCHFSVSALAELFDNTEKDILKALAYWEKAGLLKIQKNKNETITQITIQPPKPHQKQEESPSGKQKPLEQSSMPPRISDQTQTSVQTQVFPRPVYSAEQILQMKKDEQVVWLLKNVENYLKRLLKPDDVQLILYLYESLDFSPELILYLYEYCISLNKTHHHYIEAVALNWKRDNISTIEQASLTVKQYRKEYYTIARALGLSRQLADAECSFVDKWMNHWNMPLSIVVEACNRTVIQTQNPSFPYVDKILADWHNAGVHSLSDIQKEDDTFERTKRQKKPARNPAPRQNTNRFHAFEQHQYSEEELDEQERLLLQKAKRKLKKN